MTSFTPDFSSALENPMMASEDGGFSDKVCFQATLEQTSEQIKQCDCVEASTTLPSIRLSPISVFPETFHF